jgi:hypothetical protein
MGILVFLLHFSLKVKDSYHLALLMLVIIFFFVDLHPLTVKSSKLLSVLDF